MITKGSGSGTSGQVRSGSGDEEIHNMIATEVYAAIMETIS